MSGAVLGQSGKGILPCKNPGDRRYEKPLVMPVSYTVFFTHKRSLGKTPKPFCFRVVSGTGLEPATHAL